MIPDSIQTLPWGHKDIPRYQEMVEENHHIVGEAEDHPMEVETEEQLVEGADLSVFQKDHPLEGETEEHLVEGGDLSVFQKDYIMEVEAEDIQVFFEKDYHEEGEPLFKESTESSTPSVNQFEPGNQQCETRLLAEELRRFQESEKILYKPNQREKDILDLDLDEDFFKDLAELERYFEDLPLTKKTRYY